VYATCVLAPTRVTETRTTAPNPPSGVFAAAARNAFELTTMMCAAADKGYSPTMSKPEAVSAERVCAATSATVPGTSDARR
jgi:hypothetical protein